VRRVVIAGLFLLSGFCGLVYEIVWTRIFGLIFGNTTLAISTVLAAYMLGLSLGALMLGRLADNLKAPLKSYALLELGIGASALLIILLRNPVEQLFILIYPLFSNWPFVFILIKFLTSFLLMLPATFLMGGTLPVLSRAYIRTDEHLGTGVGALYGINTCGAVLGVFFTAFVLINNLGVNGSIRLAVLLNFLIFCTAFILFRFRREKSELAVIKRTAEPLKIESRLILYVMGLSGFTALAYEILWSRILVFVLSNSVYAFAIMLTAFLVGIAGGSWIGGWLADRRQNLRGMLGWLEIGIAALVVLTAVGLINITFLASKIMVVEFSTSWWSLNGLRFLIAILVMILPTLLMGITFPLAAKLIAGNITRLGTALGQQYFYNTLGGVAGSFLTGFVFVNYFGSLRTMAVMVAINLLLGLWLVWPHWSMQKVFKISFAGLVLLIPALVFFTVPRDLFSATFSTTEKNYPLIDFREGIEGTITVHRSNLPGQTNLRIDVDGLNVAGTSFMLRTLQTLQGHLPLIVNHRAEKVVQIGFGTGQTSRSALLHEISEFKLVEISADVLDLAARYFADINQGVWQNPRFNPVIMDGKNFIKYTPDRYDIIMNDANYAVATTSASLFTQDHFFSALHKLNPAGIFSTWMTTDLDPRDFAIVLRTFQSVFPNCLLWMAPNCINKQVVLMGSAETIRLDYAMIQKIIHLPDIRNNLAAININSACDLLNCLVLDSAGIASVAGQARINTDEYPILEFSRQDIRARDLCAYQNLARIMMHPPQWNNLLINFPDDSASRGQLHEILQQNRLAARLLLRGMLQFYQGRLKGALQTVLNASRLIPESKLAAQFFQDMDMITGQLVFESQHQPGNLEVQLKLIRQRIALEEYDQAFSHLLPLLHLYPQQALPFYETARCYLAGGQLDSARSYFQHSLTLNPKLSAAWYFLGEIQRQQNNQDQALDSYQRALDLDGRMYEALNAIGLINQIRGNHQQAIKLYRQSMNVLEFQPVVLANLGDCFFNINDYEQAETCYRGAIQSGEPTARLFKKAGNTNYMLKHFRQAVFYYQRSIELDSLDSESYYNLGNTMVMQNDFPRAIPCFQKAIHLNDTQADYFNNLAMCYNHSGQQAQALRIFNTGLKIHPDSELLKNNRAAMPALNNK
jgi:spermidine synthase